MKFKTRTVIAITSDLICADFGEIFDMLSYITGKKIYGHELNNIIEPCRNHILTLYPELVEVPKIEGNLSSGEVEEFLEKIEDKLGLEVEITPLPLEEFSYKNPIEELQKAIGNERIIIIKLI